MLFRSKTPYLSRSISEFWQRWHISLSSWFRDYLYIPLGGNKVKIPRFIFNVLVVFTISGFWHGASWTFIIWGFLHGFFFLLEKLIGIYFSSSKKSESWFLNGILTFKTFLIVSLIWVFFRAENLEKVKSIFYALIHNKSVAGEQLHYGYAWIMAIVLLFSDYLFFNSRFDKSMVGSPSFLRWAFYTIILFGLLTMSGVEQYPFIYFQF